MAVVQLIIFGIPLLSLAWWLWAERRLREAAVGRCGRTGLGVAMALLLSGFVWILLARREVIAVPVPAWLYALVLLWGLGALPLVGLPSVVAWALGAITRLILKGRQPSSSATLDRKWSRRKLLKTAAVTLPVWATFGAAVFSWPQISRFRIREITVRLKDLPPALDGLRIAHITDTHVGKFTHGKVLDEVAAATNRLDVDLVLFTGDLIDNSLQDLPQAVKMLQAIKSRAGLFVIEGNHDLFDDPKKFAQGVRAAGLALLRNQATTVEVRGVPVQLLGIVWNHSEIAMARDIDTVAALRDPTAFPILMVHHPHAFDQAVRQNFPLTLAGHSHGGQVMLTQEIGVGPAMFRYWSGLYQKANSALVVGNGTGNWFPLRLNAPAEIIHLTVRKA